MHTLQTISALSRTLDISTRTLRYYEEIGLIQSRRAETSAYRMYDENAIARLRQIMLLRKLRIPLKDIGAILDHSEISRILAIFEDSLYEVNGEIAALSTIRDALGMLLDALRDSPPPALEALLTDDGKIRSLMASLAPSKQLLKEEKTMRDVNQADARLARVQNVRIVHLPPATVAAAHFIGDDPEGVVSGQINNFVQTNRLWEIKPDLRCFGFNHPNPTGDHPDHGYEMWVTIPDDMEVPPPLTKKLMPGGEYAAHMIKMGDFHEWGPFDQWVRANDHYAYRGAGSPDNMFDSLEETLNYATRARLNKADIETLQLDLLIPVREKKQA